MADQPLSDVALDYWAAAAETAPSGELGTVSFPVVAQMLISELRASRAREQELQRRLRAAIKECDLLSDHRWSAGHQIAARRVRALLVDRATSTGTDPIRSMADLNRAID